MTERRRLAIKNIREAIDLHGEMTPTIERFITMASNDLLEQIGKIIRLAARPPRHKLRFQSCGLGKGGNATCEICDACYCLPPWTMESIAKTEICPGPKPKPAIDPFEKLAQPYIRATNPDA